MDENKLKKLRAIDYIIQPTCESCTHGDFGDRYKAYGTCRVHQYDHLKHSDATRQLSIHAHGHCSQYEPKLNAGMLAQLGAWMEFALVGERRTKHVDDDSTCAKCGVMMTPHEYYCPHCGVDP